MPGKGRGSLPAHGSRNPRFLQSVCLLLLVDKFSSLTHDGSGIQPVTEQLVPQTLVSQHGHVQLSQQHLLRSVGGFLEGHATETGSVLPRSKETGGTLSQPTHDLHNQPIKGDRYPTSSPIPQDTAVNRNNERLGFCFCFMKTISNLVFYSNERHTCETPAKQFTFSFLQFPE